MPTHYSDNFFSLIPGESRTVKMECDLPVENVSAEAWNVAFTPTLEWHCARAAVLVEAVKDDRFAGF